MSEIEQFGELFPIEDTLCNTCRFRLSRTLIPLNLDTFNIDVDVIKEIGEGNEIAVEQHTCLIIGEDMDYIVHQCNKYESSDEVTIFKHDLDL